MEMIREDGDGAFWPLSVTRATWRPPPWPPICSTCFASPAPRHDYRSSFARGWSSSPIRGVDRSTLGTPRAAAARAATA